MRVAALLFALLLPFAGCIGAVDVEPAAVALPSLQVLCVSGEAADACNRELSGPAVQEFAIAVNPLDPLNVIIVGNDYDTPQRAAVPGAHRLWGSWWATKDGGETWKQGTLPGMTPDFRSSLFGYQFVGDLVTAFGPDGTAYIAGIGYTSAGIASRNTLFLATSTDGGATFADPQLLDTFPTDLKFHDKPAIAIDDDGRMYITWVLGDTTPMSEIPGMRFGASPDGGKTWDFTWLPLKGYPTSPSIALSPDGAVNVVTRVYGSPGGLHFTRSTDGGRTFDAGHIIREMTPNEGNPPGASYRAYRLPTLAALPDGTLLCVVHDEGVSDEFDIFLMRSEDDGATWNNTRLNTDNGTGAQFTPTIATSPQGRVVVSWLDTADDLEKKGYHLMAALSDDGHNFTHVRISADPSREKDGSGWFIGDYIGAAITDERAYFAWPGLRDNERSRLHVAAVVVESPTS